MAIELSVRQKDSEGTIHVKGAVAHLGQSLPPGKEGLALRGKGIADHHGKIFYAYDSFYYVNLTDLPTQLFRGPGFLFELDQLMPRCQVFRGDELKLGTALVQIIRLTRPPLAPAARPTPVAAKLECRYVDCRRCKPSKRREVVRATSGQVSAVRDYTEPHEILRASVDFLKRLLAKPANGDHELELTPPDAIAIRERPGLNPTWPGSDVPVEKGVSREDAKVAAFEQGALTAEQFDAGVAFQFADRARKIVGVGAGILEGIWNPEGIPQANHFLLLQYAPGRKPTDDDVCVAHHVAAQISQFLATIRATRLRKQHELERKAGRESRGIFHHMLGILAAAQKSIAEIRSLARSGRAETDSRLADTQSLLQSLTNYTNQGRWRFAHDDFYYDWVDLRDLCQRVLDSVFASREEVPTLTESALADLSGGDVRLASVPCDLFAIERSVFDLVLNADRAVGKDAGCGKRVHVLLDVTERSDLPYARVRVVDDGVGMAPEAWAAIFEVRFSTEGGRHGLGGQIIADLVRRHHGFIEVASALGKGTVVGVLLPASQRDRETDLGKINRWLRPHIEHARMSALVSRSDLDAVLEKDDYLNTWYGPVEGEA